MLVVETIARIRRDHLVRGVPIKKIARDLRVSKNTVRKVVRGDETSYSYERKIQPMPKLGPWVGELERRLEANEKKPRRDRFSLLRIHEDLLALGYGGGYDAVRRYARTWRRRWRLLSPSQGFVPLSFDPGEAYQFDWSHEYARLSGVTTKVKAAHMRLCDSRMQLVQIFPRESQEMVFEAHERAFHFFGGVCRRGTGGDGAPLRSLGDFGTVAGVEFGVGHILTRATRVEVLVEYRPRFAFDGRTNFLEPARQQSVSADLSTLSGMLAAYVDLPELGVPRLVVCII